jgi:hypothetical protein
MPHTFRARILAFHGSWLSGLATLDVLLANGETYWIHCENAPTVRALDSCFGKVIRPNHTVAIPAELRVREVVLSVDGMGVLLAFTPVEDWPGLDVPDEGICE